MLRVFTFLFTDGPRGSLRRLRSQLAEDGCPESQVVLAKQLLEEQCGKHQTYYLKHLFNLSVIQKFRNFVQFNFV